MDIRAVKLACFSPTGTTRAVARAVARGIEAEDVEEIDLTRPEARARTLATGPNELLLAAVPVYGGRVPALLLDWLSRLHAKGSPAVCIVVYGNRAFEDALVELKDLVEARGAVPVAYGAYIGEHSFANDKLPTAMGRPDESDLAHARAFGAAVKDKLSALSSPADAAQTAIPGDHPYKDRSPAITEPFIDVSVACTLCGTCEQACPVEAIDLDNEVICDMAKCIRCCACIKVCPEQARSLRPGSKVEFFAKMLHEKCAEPKEPVVFI